MKKSIKNIVILSVIVVAVGLIIWWSMNFLSTEEGWVTRYANSARTGALQTKSLSNVKNVKKNYGPEGKIRSAPAVVGATVFASYYLPDRPINKKLPKKRIESLVALNAENGRKKWIFTPTPEPNHGENIIFYSPTVHKGLIYVASKYCLYALNVGTGNVIWETKFNSEISGAPAALGSKIYIGAEQGKVHAFKAKSGNKIWTFKSSRDRSKISYSPTTANGIVYVPEFPTRKGKSLLYALDAKTGNKLWSRKAKFGYTGAAAVNNQGLYVADGKSVYALNSKGGEKLWEFKMEEHMPLGTSPTLKNGKVYVGDKTRTIYAVNVKTGKKAWDYTAKSNLWPESFTEKSTKVTSVTAAGDKVYFEVQDTLLPKNKKKKLKFRKKDVHRITYCLNADTGKKLWERGYKYKTLAYSFAPVVIDGKMYGVDEDFNLKVLSGD